VPILRLGKNVMKRYEGGDFVSIVAGKKQQYRQNL
tara:strand:- start:22724 stop:22828 length:105 start_codon:yes stop_codon:yes gene_type:complete